MTNNKARPAYANVTTGQMAHAENPDTVSEKLKNVKDAQKIMFYDVIKTLIWYSRSNPNQEPTIELPNGKQATIKLLAKSIQNVDQNLLTNDDKAILKSNPDFNIITTMLADQDGNVLQFDEEGNIVEEGGRAVYQYIRPVIKRDGKLFLGNRAGKLYTLVAAEDLAKQELRNMLDAGQILTSAEKKRVRGEIKAKQLETLNAIYRLTQTLNGDQISVPEQTTYEIKKYDTGLEQIVLYRKGKKIGHLDISTDEKKISDPKVNALYNANPERKTIVNIDLNPAEQGKGLGKYLYKLALIYCSTV